MRAALRGLAGDRVVHRQFRRVTLMALEGLEGRSCHAGEDCED